MVRHAQVILGLDPGETTGTASRDSKGHYAAWNLRTPPEVFGAIHSVRPDLLVVECFVYTGYANPHKTYTVKLVGGIEALAWKLKIPIRFQRPAERYPFMEKAEAFLKERGGKYTQHEIDALSHIYTYEERSECTKESLKTTSKRARP